MRILILLVHYNYRKVAKMGRVPGYFGGLEEIFLYHSHDICKFWQRSEAFLTRRCRRKLPKIRENRVFCYQPNLISSWTDTASITNKPHSSPIALALVWYHDRPPNHQLLGAATSMGAIRTGIGLALCYVFCPQKELDLHQRWAPALGTFVGPSTKALGGRGDAEMSWCLEQMRWKDAIRLCFSLRHEVGVHFGKSMLFQGNAVSRQSMHGRDVRYKHGMFIYILPCWRKGLHSM